TAASLAHSGGSQLPHGIPQFLPQSALRKRNAEALGRVLQARTVARIHDAVALSGRRALRVALLPERSVGPGQQESRGKDQDERPDTDHELGFPVHVRSLAPLLSDDARAAHPAELAAEGGVPALDTEDKRFAGERHGFLDAGQHDLRAAFLPPGQPAAAHGVAKDIAGALGHVLDALLHEVGLAQARDRLELRLHLRKRRGVHAVTLELVAGAHLVALLLRRVLELQPLGHAPVPLVGLVLAVLAPAVVAQRFGATRDFPRVTLHRTPE